MEEKTFINGLFIREKQFDNGGSIIKIDVSVDSLTKQLNELKNEKGFVSIDIKKRQNSSENGLTHYAELNTFVKANFINKSTNNNQQSQPIQQRPTSNNDVPF